MNNYNRTRFWCLKCGASATLEDLMVTCDDENCAYGITIMSYSSPNSSPPSPPIMNNNEMINNSKAAPSQEVRRKTSPKESGGACVGSKRPKSKKIGMDESRTIVDSYGYHKGNWRAIMEDPKIKSLNRNKTHLQRHIEYLKKKKNTFLSPTRASFDLRGSVIEELEAQEEEEDEEDNIPFNGDNRLEIIDDVDKHQLSESISSAQFKDPEYRDSIIDSLSEKEKERRKIVQLKSKEKKEIINEIRREREEKERTQNLSNTLLSLMVKQMMDEQAEKRAFLQLISVLVSKHMGGENKE